MVLNLLRDTENNPKNKGILADEPPVPRMEHLRKHDFAME